MLRHPTAWPARRRRSGVLFGGYADKMVAASEQARKNAEGIGEELARGSSELNSAAELVATRAGEIASLLRQQVVQVTDRLKVAFDAQAGALNTFTDRTGERIDRLSDALNRQTAMFAQSVENVLDRHGQALSRSLDTTKGRIDQFGAQLDEQAETVSGRLDDALTKHADAMVGLTTQTGEQVQEITLGLREQTQILAHATEKSGAQVAGVKTTVKLQVEELARIAEEVA